MNAEDTPIVEFEGRDSSNYQGQWVIAGNLKAGHKVLLSNGKNGIISSVETEELDEPVATYNFEVEDYHTYYVGSEGILVHNACGTDAIDDVANSADDVVHGNSLRSTRTNYGYKLVDRTTNETLKFGESINGIKRYSNVFYETTNSKMVIMTQGSKAQVHLWQHNQIVQYFDDFGHLPPMNKSFW